jgi:hypothetical protein
MRMHTRHIGPRAGRSAATFRWTIQSRSGSLAAGLSAHAGRGPQREEGFSALDAVIDRAVDHRALGRVSCVLPVPLAAFWRLVPLARAFLSLRDVLRLKPWVRTVFDFLAVVLRKMLERREALQIRDVVVRWIAVDVVDVALRRDHSVVELPDNAVEASASTCSVGIEVRSRPEEPLAVE